MMMFGRKKPKKFDLDEEKQKLEEAKKKQHQVEEHTPEVERVASESRQHVKGNGFYDLFKQGLKGA